MLHLSLARPFLSARRIALCVGVLLVAFIAASPHARTVTPRGDLTPDERVTIDVFERSKRSVVYISTLERVRDPWTRNVRSIQRGTGSGFVWDERGDIITNYHVIAGASAARVRLNDGRDYPATLIGASESLAMAVLAPAWAPVVSFSVLIVILLWDPEWL